MQLFKGLTSIDDYIAKFPADIQILLERMRTTIRKAAPDATEKISYQMPTFYLKGNLVHFAALKNHIGFYPTPSAIIAFRKELTGYISSKGAVQFPIDEPLPLDLVTKMVKFRTKENLQKAELKLKK
jgi:uncharacterized protein YdhG (YjbR/CyaY superfamily)